MSLAVEPMRAVAATGLWRLTWRRLRHDRVGLAALMVLVLYLAVMTGSATGLIASGWSREVAVSYAPPAFLGPDAAAGAGAAAQAGPAAVPDDLVIPDPLAGFL